MLHAGKYYVVVTNANSCQKKDSVTVTINAAPTAQTLFADSSICEGTTLQLSGSGGGTWQWEPATKDGKPIKSDVEVVVELPLKQQR